MTTELPGVSADDRGRNGGHWPALFWASVLLCLLGVAFLAASASDWWLDLRLREGGAVAATGTVVEKTTRKRQTENGEGEVSHWLLGIDFADMQGVRHRVDKAVSEETWASYQPGDTTPSVEYLKRDPTACRLFGLDGDWRGYLYAGLGCEVLGTAGLFLALRWRFLARRG